MLDIYILHCLQLEASDGAYYNSLILSLTLLYVKYVFITAQILHGIGAAALTTLGTTLLDESVSKTSAPMYIGMFEACFVLGPAFG